MVAASEVLNLDGVVIEIYYGSEIPVITWGFKLQFDNNTFSKKFCYVL